MSDLLIVADLGALGDVARDLGATFGGTDHDDVAPPSLQHAGADAALEQFGSAVRAQRASLAAHAAAGASAMRGFAVAFHNAGA